MSAPVSFPAPECRSTGNVLVKMGTLPRRGAERDRQGGGGGGEINLYMYPETRRVPDKHTENTTEITYN